MLEKLLRFLRSSRVDPSALSKAEAKIALLKRRAEQFQKASLYEDARDVAAKVRKVVESEYGAEHPDYVWALKSQAFSNWRLGDSLEFGDRRR
jgi:hypothetical protein